MAIYARRLVALLGVALALSGCVAYPTPYGYAYAPARVAVAVPCCAYVGYGYRRW